MMRRFLRPWTRSRTILSDERGMSVVEFAFIAPFLGLLTVGMADIGRGYIERYRVQQAANRTIELAHHGTEGNDYRFLATAGADALDMESPTVTKLDDYKYRAASTGGGSAVVTLTQWLECTPTSGTSSGVSTRKPFGQTCASNELLARYVTVEMLQYFDPTFTTAGYPDVTSTGLVPLRARASLRVQ